MYRKPWWSSDDADDDEQDREVLNPRSRMKSTNIFKRVTPVDEEKTAKKPHLWIWKEDCFATARFQSIAKLKTSYEGFAPVVAEKNNPKVPRPRLGLVMGLSPTTTQSYEPKTKSHKDVMAFFEPQRTPVDVEEENSKMPLFSSRVMRNQSVRTQSKSALVDWSHVFDQGNSERKLKQEPWSRRQLRGPYKIPRRLQSREKCIHLFDEEEIPEVKPVSSKVTRRNQPAFAKPTISHPTISWSSCDFIRPSTSVKRNILVRNTQGYDGFVSSDDEGEEEMSVVSCYKFRKEAIGFGAFGTCVYKGANTKDNRKVAIKKINCHTSKQTHQYKREVKYLLLLSGCPNIVKYLDVVVEQNTVYIILELMEGTLETLVNQSDRNIKFTEVSHDITSALQFLHRDDIMIVHRDIKPRNILFVSFPRLKLKLADFGLSKMLDSDSSSIGYNGGTRCWMAPEVHRSLDQFSTASDVFATGLVLHYLMASRHPFAPVDTTCTRENRLLVEHDIVHNILNQHLNVDSSLSPEAFHLINQMLKDNKDQRPNADEVLAHPFFWSNQKKMKFLEATANQPEIFQRGTNDFKRDLEMTQLGAQFQTVPWSEQSDAMVDIYVEMMMAGRRKYNTSSVAGLLRFMRNAYQHVSEAVHTEVFRKYLLKDFIFLNEFKSLVIDVYEVVLEHEWEQNKEEVMYAMS